MDTKIYHEKRWPMLYTKTASGGINYWEIRTEGAYIHSRWGTMGGEELTYCVTAEGKNVGRSNETTATHQAQLEAQSKHDKKLRMKYFESIEDAQGKLNLKPMLAGKLDEKRAKKISFPVHVQPKLNGVRCIAYALPDGSVRLMSRGGKDYTLPHIQDELKGVLADGRHIDGELYAHGISLQRTVSLIKTYCEESVQVRFSLYDNFWIDKAEMPWMERFDELVLFQAGFPWKYLDLTRTDEATTMAQVDRMHDEYVAQKYEGAIVRLLQGAYRIAARSNELLKYKKFLDDEFVVKGWEIGRSGHIVFICVQEEGKEFRVAPEGTAEERAEMLADAPNKIGQKLTVRYKDRSDDNIPQHLVGVAFRSEEDL